MNIGASVSNGKWCSFKKKLLKLHTSVSHRIASYDST
jgi:hypothetical protein